MLDNAKIVQEFWNVLKDIFVQTNNRDEFLIKFKNHLFVDKTIYLPEEDLEWVKQALSSSSKSFDWLKVKNFERIHQVFREGRFLFLPLDLIDRANGIKLGSLLKELSIEVDTLYTSNIKDFVGPREFDCFRDSFNSLVRPGAIVVDTEDRPFKITKRFQFEYIQQIYSSYSFCFKNFNYVHLRQQVNYFNVEKQMPILNLVDKFKTSNTSLDLLFYEYGIEKGYYTREEANQVYAEANEFEKSKKGIDLGELLMFECGRFYPDLSNVTGSKRKREEE